MGYWLLVLVTDPPDHGPDYRLRANQHYMLNWPARFLFLPGSACPAASSGVAYFWAGVPKLIAMAVRRRAVYNRDRLWLPASLVPASCVYVVLLEMTMIFGLFAAKPGLLRDPGSTRAFTSSWPIVGFCTRR